jgi:hypothetical protein
MLLCLIVLLSIAFLGSRTSFSHIRLPIMAQQIYLTGTEFILVGFLLGPLGLNLLDPRTMSDLQPLMTFSLGWIGLLFGLQLEFKLLKTFPREYISMSLVHTIAVGLLSFGIYMECLDRITGAGKTSIIAPAIVLAVSAACTAQSSLAIFQKVRRFTHTRLMDFLRFSSSIDAVPAVIIIGLLSCWHSSVKILPAPVPASAQWLIFTVLTGLTLGYLLDLLIKPTSRHSERLLFAMGFTCFASGIAFYCHQSVLFLATLSGFMIANRNHASHLYKLMLILEKPVYVVLLILAGAMVDTISASAVWLGVIYVSVRLFVKLTAGIFTASFYRKKTPISPAFGVGLLSQGGISLAIAVSYRTALQGPYADLILFVILVSIFINEILSLYFLPSLLNVRKV